MLYRNRHFKLLNTNSNINPDPRHSPEPYFFSVSSGLLLYDRDCGIAVFSCYYLTDYLTVITELKMVFRLTDRNNDGSITAEELKRMLLDKLEIEVDDALIGELMTSAGENGQRV